MSESWRDRQGFTRPEREKQERVDALRTRFSAVTDAFLLRYRSDGGLLWPALVGLVAGGALFVVVTNPVAVAKAKDALIYYPNCATARMLGAAPVYRDEPGYAPHLDADADGVGCEPYPH